MVDGWVTPSATGFALYTAAARIFPESPANWMGSAMLGTWISDPGGMYGASNQHTAIANKLNSVNSDMTASVQKLVGDGTKDPTNKDAWTTADGLAFGTQAQPAMKQALQDAASQHTGLASTMNSLGNIYVALGAAAVGIGGWQLANAICGQFGMSVSWLGIGAPAVAAAEANAAAGADTTGATTQSTQAAAKAGQGLMRGIMSKMLKNKYVMSELALLGGQEMYAKPKVSSSTQMPVSWPTATSASASSDDGSLTGG